MSAPYAIPSIDAWTRAHERFTEDLSLEEKELYSKATANSVFYEASAAEKAHKANSSSRKFATEKLRPLVSAIVEYGKALDVYANAYPLVLSPLWGSIRVVLHIALEFGDYFDKIVDMFIQIGNILPQLVDYEKLFESHARLALAITATYVDILEFCADAKSIFRSAKRPSMVNLLVFSRSSWRPFKDRFKKTLDSFEEHRKQVEKEAGISHMIEAKRAQELAHDARLKAECEKKEIERLKILAMLSTTNYKQRQRSLHQLRHPGTCDWLLKLPDYQQWRASTSSTCLHCHGIPGSGKSILASAVVNELHLKTRSDPEVVAYYYCDYADQTTLVSRSIIGSLLQQLLYNIQLSSELADAIQHVFADDNASPTQQEFKNILRAMMSVIPSSFLVIDGLDECDKETRRDVLTLINWVIDQKISVVRVYVSSQSDVQILNALATSPRISVSSEMLSSDIATYVLHATQSLIQDRQLLIQNPALEHEIIEELKNKAKGMFLWVIFQLQDLCEATSDQAIRRTLNNLPEGLYETYDRKVAKIEAGQTSILVARTFQWIIAALRPLSIQEIQEAIAVDQDDTCWIMDKLSHPDKIIGSCQNLVILHEDGKLSFAHHTVRSFLLSRKPQTLRSPLTFDLEAANIRAALVCVTYLSFTDFEAQIAHRPQEMVLPTGVIQSGGLLHLTRSLGISDFCFSLPYRLLGGSPRHVSIPTEIKWATFSPRSAIAPTLTEKYKLLDYAIQNWLLHTKDLPLIDREPNHYKMWNYQEILVNGKYTAWARFSELALERLMAFDQFLWTSQSNYKDLLLPFDAMFRWALENAHVPLLTLLEVPSRGPPLIIYLQRYLQNGQDILRTPCIKGDIKLLNFLVNYCQEIKKDIRSFFREEYLSWCASLNGHMPVVKLLLREGVNVNTKTERPHYVPDIGGFPSATALQLAVLNGHNEVVDALLTDGASIDQWSHHGLHPLHYAPNPEIVRLLLRRGADVNVKKLQNFRGDLEAVFHVHPIHTAAAAGRTAVVEKLLSSGAKANVLDPCMRTPLQLACDSATARIILKFDTESINNADSEGETCLISAASKGSPDLVKLFCDRGASTDAVDHQGQTALHKACISGHVETVRVLLARTCQQINSRDNDFMTPLDRAVASRNVDLASVLSQAGAHNTKFMVLELHEVAERGDTKMVDLLLDFGISVDSFNREGRTALQCAVDHESILVLELLIERQASVNIRIPTPVGGIIPNDWPTPLIVASVRGHVEMVKMLLKAGANCDTQDNQSRTALFHAIDLYHYEVARLLMAHNAHPFISAYPRIFDSSTTPEWQTSLQILEDRREDTDREMYEDLKSYQEKWTEKKIAPS